MIFRRTLILILTFLFSSFTFFNLTETSTKKPNEIKPSQIINLDSLRTLISASGWNSDFLDLYKHALLNFPVELKIESEKLNHVPGIFEKLFLQAVILKRSGNYRDMLDSLLVGFDLYPKYLPFFDELVFAVKATNQSTFLENLLRNTSKIGEAQLAYLSGLLHSLNAEQEDALKSFQKADSLVSNDKNILLKLFQAFRRVGDIKNSGEVLDKLKKIYGDDDILKPKLLLAEGTSFFLSKDFKKAKELYTKALEAAIKAEDKSSQSKALMSIGNYESNAHEMIKARNLFKKGFAAAKDVNDIEALALAYSALGKSFAATNELVEAKKNYLLGYDLYKKLENSVRLSFLSNNLGRLYMNFFDYNSAIKYFEEGTQFAGNNKRAEAVNLTGLADVYANLSNYSKALKYYREAQKIAAGIKAIGLNGEISTGLGTMNFNLDRFSNASFYYQYALELQSNSGNSYIAADICHKLGLIYLRMDSLLAAEKYFKQSIELSAFSKNEYSAALSFSDLADLYFSKKDFNIATVFLSKAKSVAHKHQWGQITAKEEILEGKINAERKYFEPAKRNFQNALKIATELNDFNLQIIANHHLGKLFHNYGFAEAAESFYKSGISSAEDVSHPLFQDIELQISFFNARRDLYDSYARLLLENKKYEEAFLVIDKSRSANTMQNLANLKLLSLSKDGNSIEKLYELDWTLNSNKHSKTETDSLRRTLAELKHNLTVKHPELKHIIEPKHTSKTSDIQKFLTGKENFISIYLTENNSYLFLVTQKKFKTIVLNVNRKTITDLISKISPHFDHSFRAQSFSSKDLFAFNTIYAHELYKLIMEPVTDRIHKNEKLIFSPSSELMAFPFECLVSNNTASDSQNNYSDMKFLITDYPISYTPSAAVYVEEAQNKSSNNDKVLIVGDPAIDNQSEEFLQRTGLLEESVSSTNILTLQPSENSGAEVTIIGDIIKADKVLLSKDATETSFKQNAEASKVIHLSTHSILYKKQPLILFSNFYDPENDGFLEASEIVRLKLNSDLVVLSSSSSGLGKFDESEGITEMTKAFFTAGSKSIVVTLWEVNDKSTSKLMSCFYKKLSEGYDKSEALRHAKLEFIKDQSPNPYFWAAFVLSGNTSKVELETPSVIKPYITVILFIVFVAILIYFLIRRRRQVQIS